MIVKHTDTSHTTKLVPRFYPCNELTLTIRDRVKNIDTDVNPTYRVGNDNKLSLTFDYAFDNDKRYSYVLKQTDNDDVLFRGIIISTTADPQEFKLTENKLYY